MAGKLTKYEKLQDSTNNIHYLWLIGIVKFEEASELLYRISSYRAMERARDRVNDSDKSKNRV